MLIHKAKQAKCLFFSFRDKISVINDFMPVLAMIGSIIMFGLLLYVQLTGKGLQSFPDNDWIGRHCIDTTGLFILYMFSQSKTYRWYSWFSLSSLSILWLLNIFYVLFNWQQDAYYTCYVIIIYSIFVILSVAKITNRC